MSNSRIPEGVNGSILAPQQRSQAWYLLTEASRSVGRKTKWQENLKMKARTLLRVVINVGVENSHLLLTGHPPARK
ncbi:Uncharacterized protein APZ42_027231 [Daphnia magna]|uniref:Uncharacterized protein n=1 Tax=Daphnia magna TaxID=35525 RepID=A0A164RDN9_9CRUS|nr:Uncharacterized protein APZ42_027231 [Daphnia magna]